MTDRPSDGAGNEQPTELKDSNPNAAGPDRAAGGMGISSERVGPTGGGGQGTDGEKDTSASPHTDDAGDVVSSDAEFAPGDEDNPEGLDPRSGYPSPDPRSAETPYKDA